MPTKIIRDYNEIIYIISGIAFVILIIATGVDAFVESEKVTHEERLMRQQKRVDTPFFPGQTTPVPLYEFQGVTPVEFDNSYIPTPTEVLQPTIEPTLAESQCIDSDISYGEEEQKYYSGNVNYKANQYNETTTIDMCSYTDFKKVDEKYCKVENGKLTGVGITVYDCPNGCYNGACRR